MRALGKALLEHLLASPAGGLLGGRRAASRTLVLAYHNILPDRGPPAGDAPLHLPVGAFEEQLRILGRRADVVPLAEALTPHRDRLRVAITFDDAYHGAITLGRAALERAGFPWTLFVAPGLLGRGVPWWDQLAGPNGLPGEVRSHALGPLAGQTERVLEWARGSGRPPTELGAPYRLATEEEVLALAGAPGLTVGAHSWSHAALPSLGEAELEREVRTTRDWLALSGLASCDDLALPYGLGGERELSVAARHGHRAVLLVTGGWLPHGAAPRSLLPRFAVSSRLSAAGFAARLRGFLLGR